MGTDIPYLSPRLAFAPSLTVSPCPRLTTPSTSSSRLPYRVSWRRQRSATTPAPALAPLTMTLQEPSAAASPSGASASANGDGGGAFDPEDGVRPSLKTMSAYTPIVPYDVLAERLGRDPSDIVKLDANENPYGPAPSAQRALADERYLHIYPDPESTALRAALADYTGISADYLLAGAGADELIDLIFRLLIDPAAVDSVVNCGPTFGMYRFDADVNDARIVNVPRRAGDFAVDVDAIEAVFSNSSNTASGGAPAPKVVFIASPNNPDGSVLSDEELKRLLRLPTLVVLDEAYFEFCDHDRIKWVPQYNNLVVLRTFSKWAGLAGLRVGYGAFPPNILKHLWKIKQPYNVSVAAQSAAIASIREKEDLLAKVDRMVAQRQRFFEKVRQFADWLSPYPSQSNYVLCRVSGGRTAAEVKQALMDRGILIRYYTTPGISDCIRVSMGTEEQMERLYKALAEL